MERSALNLREALGVIGRHKIMIVTITAVATLGSLTFSTAQPKGYEASAYLVVRPAVAPVAFSSGAGGSAGPLGRDVSIQSHARIIESDLVGERVKEVLGMPNSARQLASAVTVYVLTDEVLRVSARSRKPELAQDLANAFANEYLGYERAKVEDALSDLADDLATRVVALERRSAELDSRFVKLSIQLSDARSRKRSVEKDAIVGALTADMERVRVERNEVLTRLGQMRARQEDLRATMSGTPGGGEILQEALLPSRAASPIPMRDGAIGLILGLIIGVVASLLRHHFDDRIRSAHDVVRATGVPVLGEIPRARWRRKREAYLAALGEPGSPAAESYRSLRQKLAAIGVGSELKTILVTSGSKGAGKSSTAANLAVAFAQSGRRVIVLSADLRRPRVHQFFGMSNDAGLSEVLEGDVKPLDAVTPTAVPDLSIVASGATPRNPAALLDGRALAEALDAYRGVSDVIIIDASPISLGADAMVLAANADVTLVVMRREFARAAGATAAVGGLAQAGGRRIGAVLTLAESGITHGFDYEPQTLEPASIAAPYANGNGHASNGNGHGVEAFPQVSDLLTLEATEPTQFDTGAPRRSRSRKPKDTQ